jgi:ankyrin repeat protein
MQTLTMSTLTDDIDFDTLIYNAIKNGDYNKFCELLGSDANQQQIIATRKIVDHDGSRNKKRKDIISLIILTACYGRIEMMDYLLDIDGVDVNDRDCRGCTALINIVEDVHKSTASKLCFQRLLSHPAIDVNMHENTQSSALLFAAIDEQYLLALTMLLKHKNIDINRECQYGSTALSLASSHNCATNVRQLLKYERTDVNHLNKMKRTPLLISCGFYKGDEKRMLTVRQLLDNTHIDVNQIDCCDKTALQYGERCDCVFTVAIILHNRI